MNGCLFAVFSLTNPKCHTIFFCMFFDHVKLHFFVFPFYFWMMRAGFYCNILVYTQLNKLNSKNEHIYWQTFVVCEFYCYNKKKLIERHWMRMIKSLIFTAIFNYFIIRRRRKKILKNYYPRLWGNRFTLFDSLYCVFDFINWFNENYLYKKRVIYVKNLRYICFENDKLF